ncbi:DEAD/DEAH box helicase [Bacillus sp. FJAT-44742]|uniref:DEAD/DEAH box helicase n=1 Tax=Bacillus sp. FJAT-44742 TaxID=2014005 RepID=UPI0022B7FC6A|nr:DEAD/DEAH box helicase [Bacillus sp. FJAT-44742]
MTLFKELNLDQQILRAVEQMGFTEATPIQEKVIPFVKEGKDLIGQAQTGTGKTAAFGIPLLENIDTEEKVTQGLVLAPTRELANQVAEELNKLGRFKGIEALPIYGGQEIGRQIKALKRRPQIIVATPGRFMDHMRRKTIRPQTLKMIVLDEADEMLSMGFIEDIETILAEVPKERQTLLFSATMPKRLQSVTKNFMKDPEVVAIKSKGLTVSSIEQRYIEVPEKQKLDTLRYLLDIDPPELSIIFGRTKRRVDELSEALSQVGYAVEGIHGDLRQERRDKVLRKFKKGTINILVATDVAARGLDVTGVTHVYNFDLPQDSESYVHRIGRTGRAGEKGVAFTFVTPREMEHLKDIEATTKSKMKRQSLPTYAEAMAGRYQQAIEQLRETVRKGGYEDLDEAAKGLLDEYGAETLVAAALKMATKEPDDKNIKLTEEASLRPKKSSFRGKSGNNKGNKGGRGRNNKFSFDKQGRKGGRDRKARR